MKKFVKNKDKYTNEFVEYKEGKEIIKYFYLICDICGVKHPEVCVNQFDKEDNFGECEICWDCQKDLYCAKNRKCKQCKKTIRDLKKAVKLYYFFDMPVYFCNYNCYIKFVKKHHPTTKKEWDKKFNKLSEKQKRAYLSRLRKSKRLVKKLMKEYGDNYHLKGIHHAYIWQRPKYD